MANFFSYPSMNRTTEISVPNSLNPKSSPVTIALNSNAEPDGTFLEILSQPYIGVRKTLVVGRVQVYEVSGFHPGRWVLEARTTAGVVRDVLTAVVENRESFFAGFDRLDYPGDSFMKTLYGETNLCWCGFYLAPAPSQGRGTSWMPKKSYLEQLGWGFAPLYLGQQASGPGSHIVTAAQGKLDAQNAANLAATAGFDVGSIIYLDIEQGAPVGAAMLAYYDAWVSELEDKTNYSPGVYCSFYQVAQKLSDKNSLPYFWVFNINKYTCGQAKGGVQNVGKTAPFPAPDPAQSGVSFAKIWQYVQGTSGCSVQTKSGGSIQNFDFDSSTSQDPSNPASL